MIDSFITTNALFLWHDLTQVLAVLLLGGLLIIALLQYRAVTSQKPRANSGRPPSLHRNLLVGIMLVGTIPALALDLLLAERSARVRQENLATSVEESAKSIAHAVDRVVDKYHSGIAIAAATIGNRGDLDAESLMQTLLLYHREYGDFLTMLTANADGDITAATTSVGGPVVRFDDINGISVTDRDYWQRPMSDGLPFVSQVFRGRGFGNDPIVAISAAIRNSNDQPIGIVEGSLNLRAFSALDSERARMDGTVMVLVDDQDRVIYATPKAGLDPLQSIANDSMLRVEREALPGATFDFAVDEIDGRKHFFAAVAETSLGWRVFVKASAEPIAQRMLQDYRVGAVLLLVAIGLSLLLAGSQVQIVAKSVRSMRRMVRKLKLGKDVDTLTVPADTPVEFLPIFDNMKKRALHLNNVYQRLQSSIENGEKLRKELIQSVASKEVEIAERTEALERANRKLSDISLQDPLTGIPNRRELDAFLTRVWAQCRRESSPIAVILADIDFFKVYNDSLGHQAGDECLVRIAKALSECATRPLDLVARFGGEEFVAVLGGATVADALVVAERMRYAVEKLRVPHPGSPHDVVTISVGAASLVPSKRGMEESLIKAADDALYYAKAAGRNRVVFDRDGEWQTYDPLQQDLDSTNVIRLITGAEQIR